jgi:cytochrome b involved in lipid metabolism
MSEVEKHNKPGDLWVVIDGKVWDMTEVSLGLLSS